jgi:hypothetical protein
MDNENSTTDAPDTSSEPTHSAVAAFLFDEVNPVFDDITPDDDTTTEDTASHTDQLTKLATEGQISHDEPVHVTDEQVTTVVPVEPAIKLAPIIEEVEKAQVQAPVTPSAPVSQAEMQKHLNIYDVSEADYDAIFATESKEDSIKALNGMMQNVVRQAVTMSHVLVQDLQANFQQQVQPYMQYADEQKHSAMESAFYSQHADLRAAQPVVDAVLKQFQGSGQKFATPEKLFDAVAQNTKAYLLQLQQLGQTATPNTRGPVQTQGVTQQGKPRMAALPSGGQGGAGAGGGNSGKVNTAQRLFG